MKDGLAREVFTVLRQGLLFREQLQQGRPLSVDGVQADLQGKLGLIRDQPPPKELPPSAHDYLGVPAPLIYWTDEIFILDSPWQQAWSDKALEVARYRTRNRANLFWEQRDLAASRPDKDALEVFYLCVLLGFRGVLRGNPAELKAQCEQFKREIGLKEKVEWPQMPHSMPEPETEIHALVAKERLRWLLLAAALVASGLIILAGFLAVWLPLRDG